MKKFFPRFTSFFLSCIIVCQISVPVLATGNISPEFDGTWVAYASDMYGNQGEKLDGYGMTIDLSANTIYTFSPDHTTPKWTIYPGQDSNSIYFENTDSQAVFFLTLRSDGKLFEKASNSFMEYYWIYEKQSANNTNISAVDLLKQRFPKVNNYHNGMFTDVSPSAWYADKVKAAYEYGLMSGVGNGLFQPTRNITIAEAIVIASKLHSTYHLSENKIQGSGTWYQPYIDYAFANQIVTQVYPNYNTPISRGEFAIIMSNAFPDAALVQINAVQDNTIPDVAAGSNYYNAVYRLYRAGVTSGVDSAGTYNPNAQITRAEAATILGNMVDTSLRRTFTLATPTTPVQPTQPTNPQKEMEEFDEFYKKYNDRMNDTLYTYGVDVVFGHYNMTVAYYSDIADTLKSINYTGNNPYIKRYLNAQSNIKDALVTYMNAILTENDQMWRQSLETIISEEKKIKELLELLMSNGYS